MPKNLLAYLARFAAILLFVGAVAALPVGCAEEKPPEEEEKPAAPPPPTAEQLAGELMGAFRPIADGVIPGAPFDFVKSNAQNFKQVYSKVNGQRASNGENVEKAVTQTKGYIEDTIRLARERDRWRFLWGALECFSTVDPSNTKYKELKVKVDLMISMPNVKLKGFVQLENDDSPYAIFDVLDLETRTLTNYRVREGEEFHNGKFLFVSIEGNQMGANIIYSPADFEFRIGGPRDRMTTIGDDEPVAE